MATASSLLEKFVCSVCLDVFKQPVSTPCGHNFCAACIQKYWDNSDICQCPFCNRTFSPRPQLEVNTVMSELAGDFEKLFQVKSPSQDPELSDRAGVVCDICTEIKEKAVKSCVMCLASFCEVHLEPHQRVAGLKSHRLLDPVRNLDDKMCKTHNKVTELYCRTDRACVCVLCLKSDHRGHSVVSLEEEYESVMATKDDAMANIQKAIRARRQKIAEIENSLDEAEKEKDAGVRAFADMIRSLRRSHVELVEVIEERFGETERKAKGFLADLEVEVAELESRSEELQQLSQSEDHHLFLQSFPASLSPLEGNHGDFDVHSDLSLEAVRDALSLLKQRVDEAVETLPEIKMRRMREHAVDVTLDPDTAYRSLVISQDGKQVAHGDAEQEAPRNPQRFQISAEVLAKEGFTAGKFYYEVEVRGSNHWIVGVVRESVDRTNDRSRSVKNGFWAIESENGVVHKSSKSFRIKQKAPLQKLGVFVDYEEGEVHFYDVDSKSAICFLTGNHFTEKLYPYFCLDETDGHSAPLVITPVPQTQFLLCGLALRKLNVEVTKLQSKTNQLLLEADLL